MYSQIQQSERADFEPAEIFFGAVDPAGMAMACSCLSAFELQSHVSVVRKSLELVTHLKGFECDCHSRPTSIRILTHL